MCIITWDLLPTRMPTVRNILVNPHGSWDAGSTRAMPRRRQPRRGQTAVSVSKNDGPPAIFTCRVAGPRIGRAGDSAVPTSGRVGFTTLPAVDPSVIGSWVEHSPSKRSRAALAFHLLYPFEARSLESTRRHDETHVHQEVRVEMQYSTVAEGLQHRPTAPVLWPLVSAASSARTPRRTNFFNHPGTRFVR